MKPESSPLYAIISCGLRKIRACLESIAPTNRKSVPPKVPGGMLGERKMVCEWPEQVRLGGTLTPLGHNAPHCKTFRSQKMQSSGIGILLAMRFREG